MCTAIKWSNYFGRTLDNMENYNMNIAITPRNYDFKFRHTNINDKHYSIIGMAYIEDNYPLYGEAANEKGLAIAALEFVDNACYFNMDLNKISICVFEVIPYILRQCDTVMDARSLLKNINIINETFNNNLYLTPLHFIISDKKDSIVLESTIKGINIYDNPYNVLTNNPEFDYHKINVNRYMHLTSKYPENNFSQNLALKPFSFSFGLIGLPGDYSSPSRFIKALFLINNSQDVKQNEAINHFFHMLDSISPVKGVALTKDNKSQFTIYSSCIDLDNLIYYYKTYWDNQIKAIKLINEDASNKLIIYKVDYYKNSIKYLN